MKTAPIVPGRWDPVTEGGERSPDRAGQHNPTIDWPSEAQRVFLDAHELPRRWAGREQFTILETGFGRGHHFLATWDAWRRDPRRCRRLVFVSIEAHPLQRDDLARAHAGSTPRWWRSCRPPGPP